MYDFLTKMDVADFVTVASSFLGAFFAFVFFLLGECILSKSKERKQLIANIKIVQEQIMDTIYYSSVNVKECENILATENSISISLSAFVPFPLENGLYRSLEKFKVREPLVMFETHLRVSNIDMQKMGKYIDILNELSLEAMQNQMEEKYRDTLGVNHQKLKENVKKFQEHLSAIQEKRGRVLAEITFTINLLQGNLFKRGYLNARLRFSKKYREQCIQNILSKQ